MAEMDDDFGDFNSAFFPSETAKEAEKTLRSDRVDVRATNSHEKANTFTTFPVSGNPTSTTAGVPPPAGTEEACPITFTSDLNFDAFSSCPVAEPGGLGFANFANFNIADVTIPHPDTVEIGGNFFDIPPLPDILSPVDFPVVERGAGVANGNSSFQMHLPQGGESPILNGMPCDNALHPHTVSEQGAVGGPSASQPVRITSPSMVAPVLSASAGIASGTAVLPSSLDDFGEFESSLRQSEPEAEPVATLPALSQPETISPVGFAGISSSSSTTPSVTSAGLVALAGQEDRGEQEASVAPSGVPVSKTEEVPESHRQGDDFGAFLGSGTETGSSQSSRGDPSGGFATFASSEGSKKRESPEGRSAQTSLDSSSEECRHSGETSGKDRSREFGAFSSAPTGHSEGEIGGFADFSSFQSTSNADSHSFGAFASSETGGSDTLLGSGCASAGAKEGKRESSSEFGGFEAAFPATGGGDEDTQFGDFSSGVMADSSQSSDFGDFSSHAQTGLAGPELVGTKVAVIQTPTPTAVKSNIVKKSGDVFVVCFSGPSDTRRGSGSPLALPIIQLHLHSPSSEQKSSHIWDSLRKSVDFTVPLYKWDKSYLQECYHGALKIDPGLAGPGALPVFATDLTSFDVPLDGQSAVEDLMESFGFGTELTSSSTLTPASPKASSEFAKNSEETAPALLDLSLPNSPDVDVQKDTFSSALAADLLGLDLNPTPSHPQQLTSIQELLLNERLVVNRSTWMDSQLLELDGRTKNSSQPDPSSSPTSLSRKQNSVEQQLLQLGLDVSKTTIVSSSQLKELSLSARTVLGQLPELACMLSDSIIEKT